MYRRIYIQGEGIESNISIPDEWELNPIQISGTNSDAEIILQRGKKRIKNKLAEKLILINRRFA